MKKKEIVCFLPSLLPTTYLPKGTYCIYLPRRFHFPTFKNLRKEKKKSTLKVADKTPSNPATYLLSKTNSEVYTSTLDVPYHIYLHLPYMYVCTYKVYIKFHVPHYRYTTL